MRRIVLLPTWLLPTHQAAAQTWRITNANVVDVSTGQLHPSSTIVIRGNRITSVGTAPRVGEAGERVVDARGMYVIPGLWDMHTHVYFGDSANVGTDLILPLFIANGITGIRDMGSALDPVLKARADVAAHKYNAPRMVVAGPMLE